MFEMDMEGNNMGESFTGEDLTADCNVGMGNWKDKAALGDMQMVRRGRRVVGQVTAGTECRPTCIFAVPLSCAVCCGGVVVRLCLLR